MSERRSAGSCADLCTRTMIAAHIECHARVALQVVQQPIAKSRARMRHLGPQRRPRVATLKRASMSASLNPDGLGMKFGGRFCDLQWCVGPPIHGTRSFIVLVTLNPRAEGGVNAALGVHHKLRLTGCFSYTASCRICRFISC